MFISRNQLRAAVATVAMQVVFGEGDDSKRPDEEPKKEGETGDATDKLPSFLNQYTLVSYGVSCVIMIGVLYIAYTVYQAFMAGDDGSDDFEKERKEANARIRQQRLEARKAKAAAEKEAAAGGKAD